MADMAIAITAEIDPPQRKARKNSGKGPQGEQKHRKPARPHRKLAQEILDQRITKLTKRLERFKSQHEATRVTLTRYAHERFYREKEAIQNAQSEAPPTLEALQEQENAK
jgi:t-SNARE complex subunit (syntaxin)